MKRQPITLGAIAAAVTVLATACQDGPAEPFSPSQLPDAQSGAQVVLRGAPGQEELVDRIPGFAGLYIDEDGVTIVNVVDPDQAGDFDSVIRSFLADRGSEAIRTRAVAYTLPELNGWFEAASPAVLGVPGAVFVDLDERANRVTIGVEDAGLIERARQIAVEAGVPEAAVQVVVTEPILRMNSVQTVSSLQDEHRPAVGGLQIHFSSFLCTLGFNATVAAEATSQAKPQGNGKGKGGGGGGGGGDAAAAESFITASHCTEKQGGVEDTQYWQPASNVNSVAIATEVDDPKYLRTKDDSSCPRGFKCRHSDAARAAYANPDDFELGKIAKPLNGPNTSAPPEGEHDMRTDWNGTSYFTITAEGTAAGPVNGPPAVVGATVNKVGRTSGWTQGKVTSTNVDTGVSGSNILLFGQTWVEATVQIVAGGDSGAAVFMKSGSDNVTLVGLLWGGNGAGTIFIYSPITNIEKELGDLTTN